MQSIRQPLRSAFAVLLVAAGTVAYGTDDSLKVRQQLQGLYGTMGRAFRDRRIEPFDRIWDTGYTVTKEDCKSFDRKALRAGYESQMKAMRDVSWPLTIKSLLLRGNEAIATVDAGWSARVGPKGKEQLLQLTAISKDTWVRARDGWKLRRSEISGSHFKVIGKPSGH